MIVDGVGEPNLEGDGLAGQGPDENLSPFFGGLISFDLGHVEFVLRRIFFFLK